MDETEPLKGVKLALITIALGLAAFMQILDTSIANVSIPYIAGDLAVSPNIGSWVITMFAVGNAISLPMTGWFAERYGSFKVIVASIVLFTLFSWLCAAAIDFNMIVFCRFFQGFVAGPLLPLSQSITILCYPSHRKNFATALFFLIIIIGPICGPLIGGWITQNYSWPWIFYINIPVGLISLVITWRILRKRDTKTCKRKVDLLGIFLLALGTGLLQIMLDKGEQYDWFRSPLILSIGVISLISLVFLIIRELSIPYPIVEFSLLKIPTFALGTFLTAVAFMMVFSAIVLIPLWLQEYMGYTAEWAGIAIAPMGILPLIFSVPYGKLVGKVRTEYLLISCLVAMSVTFFLTSYMTAQVDVGIIALLRLAFGIAILQFMQPFFFYSTTDIPSHKLASATGLFHFFRYFSGGAATSLGIYLWDRRAIFHHQRIGEFLTQFSANTKFGLKTIEAAGLTKEQSHEFLNQQLTMQAYVLATNDIFRFFAILTACLIPFVLISLKKRKAAQALKKSQALTE